MLDFIYIILKFKYYAYFGKQKFGFLKHIKK